MNDLKESLLNSPIKFKGPNKHGAYEYICIFGTGYIQYVQDVYYSDGVIGSTSRIKNIEDMKKEIIQKFKQLVNKRLDDLYLSKYISSEELIAVAKNNEEFVEDY